MSYRSRQVVTAALTANAVRPVPGYYLGVPTMVGGWLTSELAPHLAAVTAGDTLRELVAGDRDRPGLALAAGSLAGLGLVVAWSAQARGCIEGALVECLGPDYRDRLSTRHTDVDLSLPLRQLLLPFRRAADDEVEVLRDIAYSPYGRRGLLDVYRRRDQRTRSGPGVDGPGAPVLLQVHGGAWSIGDKTRQAIPLMRHMAARGWVCVAINYRLSPRHVFPAHLVDVKRAIAWVREHGPSLGADPRFVAVTGGSAGGHLAALAALTPGDPEYQPGFEDADTSLQAAVPHYGVYDVAGTTGSTRARLLRDTFLGPTVLRRRARTALEEFQKASPLLRVRPDAPPFLVVHGRHDSLVEVAQARHFVEALRAVSTSTVGYAELPGTQHVFDLFPSIRSAHVLRGVDRFLRFTHDAWQEAA
ncbi:MAG TPA: alpha/beta hydrolase [Nocardioidaceae bacterium]|nr:alpha/beta hydrolase [Nocardioidaceae bacterium]